MIGDQRYDMFVTNELPVCSNCNALLNLDFGRYANLASISYNKGSVHKDC